MLFGGVVLVIFSWESLKKKLQRSAFLWDVWQQACNFRPSARVPYKSKTEEIIACQLADHGRCTDVQKAHCTPIYHNVPPWPLNTLWTESGLRELNHYDVEVVANNI